MANDQNPLTYLKGVGPVRAQLLCKLGLDSTDALLRFYPRRYLDFNTVFPFYEAPMDQPLCICATVCSEVKETRFKGKRICVFRFQIRDASGDGRVTLYNTRFLAQSLQKGNTYKFYGKITGNDMAREMVSPRIVPADTKGLMPVYPLTEGITSSQLSKIITTALATVRPTETLSKELRERWQLCSLTDGLRMIHAPRDAAEIQTARHRFIVEEFFHTQVAMGYLKRRNRQAGAICLKTDYTDDFWSRLPFSPTAAQKRVTGECVADLMSGHPMNRLLQGDVGSGKTAVAAALCYTVRQNGYQAAIMAPTEILAEQHYATMCRFFQGTGLTCALLTGSVTAKAKRTLKDALAAGQIDLLIGTHALLTEDVAFWKLGLVITDEQHRFGVRQRSLLADKGYLAHRLVMSATPIPRTLALMMYGELDLSVLDELPNGRQPIRTFWVDDSYRQRIYDYLHKHIAAGHQAYIVCPLVGQETEEDEPTPFHAAEQDYKELTDGPFNDVRVGLLHGKMKAAAKEAVMHAFKDHQLDLLVCTSVIEVGVDVPNATCMVIENADRFGLSALHQLRGRIGRGQHASDCILIAPKNGNERLQTMVETCDGFRLADKDLALRGPGDFIGKRQHGMPLYKIADLATDIEDFRLASRMAREVLAADPTLSAPADRPLLDKVQTLLNDYELN